ncbi:hypothetical protein DPMN_049290 [Dreissena polymorpha]|uniref:Uncharacterized protein n=1 Tax=Dreissena polymorpha TaxID=45954 RepID=A0A9D4CFF7_DREPO|nr:hypothetical protein DPMN_049290 [Dreissena polymorpha]
MVLNLPEAEASSVPGHHVFYLPRLVRAQACARIRDLPMPGEWLWTSVPECEQTLESVWWPRAVTCLAW